MSEARIHEYRGYRIEEHQDSLGRPYFEVWLKHPVRRNDYATLLDAKWAVDGEMERGGR
jgi:hypothetical protein